MYKMTESTAWQLLDLLKEYVGEAYPNDDGSSEASDARQTLYGLESDLKYGRFAKLPESGVS